MKHIHEEFVKENPHLVNPPTEGFGLPPGQVSDVKHFEDFFPDYPASQHPSDLEKFICGICTANFVTFFYYNFLPV